MKSKRRKTKMIRIEKGLLKWLKVEAIKKEKTMSMFLDEIINNYKDNLKL
jgi:hypothetical protein